MYNLYTFYTNYMSHILTAYATNIMAINAIREIEKCLNMEASNDTYMDVHVPEILNHICTLRITFFNYYGICIFLGEDKNELVYPNNEYDEPIKMSNPDEVAAFIKKIPDNVIEYLKTL